MKTLNVLSLFSSAGLAETYFANVVIAEIYLKGKVDFIIATSLCQGISCMGKTPYWNRHRKHEPRSDSDE